jgi:hypothetical protein
MSLTDCYDEASFMADALAFLRRDLRGLLLTVKREVDANTANAKLRLIEGSLDSALVGVDTLIDRAEALADRMSAFADDEEPEE